jgi:SAM-dependent methyltransferase
MCLSRLLIENIYLKGYATTAKLQCGLTEYFVLFNDGRMHHSLGYSTPDKVYQAAVGDGAKIADKYRTLNKQTDDLKGKRGAATFRCMNSSGYQLKLSHFLSTGWGATSTGSTVNPMEINSDVPAGIPTHHALNQNESLKSVSTSDLFSELIVRTAFDVKAASEEQAFLSHRLWNNLQSFSDVHLNRHSLTNLKNVYSALVRPNIEHRLPVKGATWVELGCGSMNPWSFSLLLLAMGAKNVVPIDLDPVGDSKAACRTLFEMAKTIIVDPASIVGSDGSGITQQEILNNLNGFDFAKLSNGSISGIPVSRLAYRLESVYEMTLPEESVDVVVSNAFLEHVPDVDKAVESIARITKPGGYGVHIIDTIDHWFYGVPGAGPLDFLKTEQDELLVHGCNRIRPKEFVAIFERNGFEVLNASYGNPVPVTVNERSEFLSPWSAMSIDDLSPTLINIAVRRSY